MALLEGLDTVDWSKLHHAYGPATDVPMLLRALVDPTVKLPKKKRSKSGTVFEDACPELWGNVFHQGSVWQASAHVVPFLAEILRDGPAEPPEIARFVVRYLHHLAMGYPADVFPGAFDPDEVYAALEGQLDPGTPPTFGPDGVSPDVWQRDCYEAVERVLADVVRQFDSSDDETALEALALVTWFPRQREILVPRLVRVVAAHGGMRGGTALVSLAHLAPREGLELSVEHLHSGDDLVALHAACARVIAGPARIDEETFAQLLESTVDLQLPSSLAGSLDNLVARSLRLLPPEHQEVAVSAIVNLLARTESPMTRLSLSASMLGLLFGEAPPPQDSTQLTKAARRGLAAIAEHGPFRVGRSELEDLSELLRGYELPNTHAELVAWLSAR